MHLEPFSGDARISNHITPPRRRHADTDADAGGPGDLSRPDAAVLDEQTPAGQVLPVVSQRNAHRAREVTGTAAEIVDGDVVRRPSAAPDAAPAHQLDAIRRL